MIGICEDLRKSVLQAAIQGRLTQQLPEDGDAETLYAEIQKEKQKLIKEGKIKKEKPLPEITDDDIPFDIPENWMWVRLGSLWSVINGDRGKNYPAKSTLKSTGIPFISAINLNGKDVSVDDKLLCLSEDQYNRLGSGKLEKDDVVVCIRGSLGKHGVYQFGKGAIASSLVILRTVPSYLVQLTKLIMIYLDSPLFQSEIKRFDNGTAQPNLAANSLEQFIVPLPPLAEQRRIVAHVDELMARIDEMERTEKNITALYEAFPGDMKASLLQAAIQGKLTEQLASDGDAEELYQDIQKEKQGLIKEGKIKKEKPLPEITEDDIPFDIPENWKWVRWGNLSFSIQYGYNAPALQKGRIRMVRISDIQNNAVVWNTVPYCNIEEKDIPDYLLEANDILFARTGGTVGKSYLVKEVPCESIYAGYLIRTRYSSNLVSSYMKYFMESQLYWDQLKEGTTATAQPNCNGQTLSKMLIPLPPPAEQKRIVEKLDQLLPLCDSMKEAIDATA